MSSPRNPASATAASRLRAPLPPAWREAARARWTALGLRERRLVVVAVLLLAVFGIWLLAVAPALHSLRSAPARLDAVEAQLQSMRVLAEEARALRAIAPVPPGQATAALLAATERLGDAGRLALQGERAVLTLNGASGADITAWLTEVRAGARARPVEANLTRGAEGFSGTLVVALGSGA